MNENDFLANLTIEPLQASHDRSSFCCGENTLDVFLHQYASQYENKGMSRTFVAVRSGQSTILGYYSLANLSIGFEELPADAVKRLPKIPIPCILLGRLAVDQHAQGKNLGKYLLLNAMHRVVSVSEQSGSVFLIVHALHEKARQFYARFGFQEFKEEPLYLFLPIKNIKASMLGCGR